MIANLHIGFDDTDSPRGGCTTYIAALLVEKLENLGATFTDYPNLVRLNPNVPWKTRGNGALCLRLSCDRATAHSIFEVVADTIEANSVLGVKDTDPGFVFFQGDAIPEELRAFAKETIQGIVRMNQARKLINRLKAEALGFGAGYGLVGALAAVGEPLEGDHTYEVIAYRTPEYRGTSRQLSMESVERMNQETVQQTFNNIDPETQRVLITPRGPDPILYGIRGETAEAVVQAHRCVYALEPIERWVIFRTNHGTDAHLRRVDAISDIQQYQSVILRGTVTSKPKLVRRRHRIFTIGDTTGAVDCAAYEPTGRLRKIAWQLIPGDILEVSGGVRPSTSLQPLTVNLEKMVILKLAPKYKSCNLKCPKCRKRMSSMGWGQGLKCARCGFKSVSKKRILVQEKRRISEGLFIVSPRSQRHLTKPVSRYGREKCGKPRGMVGDWHSP